MSRPAQLTELVGIAHPIVQAPMAGVTKPELVAAVGNAGGLGSFGCAMLSVASVREQLAEARSLTDAPINLNFFANEPAEPDEARAETARRLVAQYYEELGLGPVPEAADVRVHFDEEMLEAVLSLRPEVVSFHFGLPATAMVDAIKEVGSVILSTATTVYEARQLEERGVDAVIAQGWEAGGHRGTFASSVEDAQIGTFSLVPQVVDAVAVPVIAAGGISDRRGVRAALALGASGVQVGTAFLRCPEAALPEAYSRALSEADEHATTVTRAFTGRPARSLRNRYVDELEAHDGELPPFPLMMAFQRPLRVESGERGSPDFMPLWSGQSAALADALPAGELVAQFAEAAAETGHAA